MLALLLPLIASAGVPDMYGTGARAMGMGMGGVGYIDDGNAARSNPAGLGFLRQPTVGLGLSSAMHHFDELPPVYWDTDRDGVVDERDTPLQLPGVEDANGFHMYAGRNVGGKFGLGVNAYIPTTRLIRFATFEPTLPNYFMYSNRPQRFSAAAGVGGKVLPGVSIGAALEILAAAKVDVWMTLDATVSGDASAPILSDVRITTHEISLDVRAASAPILGLQLDVGEWFAGLKGLQLGAVYRGTSGLPVDVNLDIQANVHLEDVGDLDPYILGLVLSSKLNLLDHYLPSYVALGVAWRSDRVFSAYADARFTRWTGFTLDAAHVDEASSHVHAPLVGLDDILVDGHNQGEPVLRNTVELRVGTELTMPRREVKGRARYLELSLRGGVALFPSPLVSQPDATALLDTNRTAFTLGLGLEHWDPFELVDAPVRYDLFAQVHLLANDRLAHSADTPTAGFPVQGDSLPIGGDIVVLGGQWGFDF